MDNYTHTNKQIQKCKKRMYGELCCARYIFGKFDSFCSRLKNLLSMFEQIGLFTGCCTFCIAIY